jgi:predicted Zn-dependent protease
MSRETQLVEAMLSMIDGRAEAEVFADVGTAALTRFANSFIHQNVSEEVAAVTLRVAADGKVASSTSTVTTPDSLRTFVDATLDVASQQPVDDEWPGVGNPVEQLDVDHWDAPTATADPTDRAEAVKAFIDAGEGLSAAGYCQTEARARAYGNTAGRMAHGRFTTAVLDGIHQTQTSAGSGHAAGVAIGGIDATAVGSRAAQRARDGVDPFDAKPGEYEVVLSPECVASVAIFLDSYGFNAKVAEEGMSFAVLGDMQFDASINIWDDATDPRSLYTGFDVEGTPKPRLDLVKDGFTSSLIHSRRTAAKAGVASTGNAAPEADVSGPSAWNLFVGGGTESVDELIAGVERGVYVSTFNYCRVLDPKSLIVTGLTRNGTFMIENGRITDPITNMRFTQSFVSALGEGNVLGLGDDGRFADSEDGPTFVHAPSLRLRSWRFTGGAEG